jgi:hypothetical protein
MRKIFLSIACLVVLAACNNQKTVESTADSKETSEIAAPDTASAPAFKFEKEVYDFRKSHRWGCCNLRFQI